MESLKLISYQNHLFWPTVLKPEGKKGKKAKYGLNMYQIRSKSNSKQIQYTKQYYIIN